MLPQAVVVNAGGCGTRGTQALPPGKPRLPTDSYVEPSDWDFFLRGRQEGTAPKRPAAPSADGSTKP